MADTENFAFEFYLPSNIKNLNAQEFGENQLRQEYTPHVNPAVDGYNPTDIYDKLKNEGKEEDAQKLLDLYALKKVVELEYGKGENRAGAEKNYAEIQLNSQQKPMMVIKNLGGTGLNFDIEEGKTVVFPKDAQLTPEQVKELVHFFYVQGIPTEGLENFMFPPEQDLEVIDSEHNVSSFKENFKSELESFYQQERHQEDSRNNSNHWQGGSDLKEPIVWGTPYQMAEKVKARMCIADESRAQIHCVRRDGGYYVYVYKDQKAADEDGKIDNKGHRAETKTCGIFCTIENGVPKALIYTPSGKFDKNSTRYALEALKVIGCTHVKAPSAMIFGKEGTGAFLGNCGKILICPRVDPPRFALDTGNVEDLIGAIDKEKKNSLDKRNAFKKVLAKELRRQANIQAYQKMYGTSKVPSPEELAVFCRDVPLEKRKSADSDFEDKITELEMGLNSDNLRRFTNSKLRAYYNKQLIGAEGGKKWDAVDCIAAVKAYKEFVEEYQKHPEYGSMYPKEQDKLLQIYIAKIDKYKQESASEIEEQLANNRDSNGSEGRYSKTDAVKDVFLNAKEALSDTVENIKLDYDKFSIWQGCSLQKIYNSENYFENGDPTRPRNNQRTQGRNPRRPYGYAGRSY